MGILLEVLEWFDATGDEMTRGSTVPGNRVRRPQVGRPAHRAREPVGDLHEGRLRGLLRQPEGLHERKVFTNLRWGTREPVAFRDSELGLVRLSAVGTYACRIIRPVHFLDTLVGSRGTAGSREVGEVLREVIVARLTDVLDEGCGPSSTSRTGTTSWRAWASASARWCPA